MTNMRWLRSNLNWGKLDSFYWMLAVLGVLNFLAFLVFAMRHQYMTLQYNSSDVYGENELKKGWNEGITSEMEKRELKERRNLRSYTFNSLFMLFLALYSTYYVLIMYHLGRKKYNIFSYIHIQIRRYKHSYLFIH